MDAYQAYWLWYDFNHVVSSAVSHKRDYVDRHDKYIDWDRQEQSLQIAGLSFACSMFEAMGVKHHRPHNLVLAHLRNALLHNSGNIDANRGAPRPKEECLEYISGSYWEEFDPAGKKVQRQFFEIGDDSLVRINGRLFFFIERLFDSHMTDEERQRPRPRRSHP